MSTIASGAHAAYGTSGADRPAPRRVDGTVFLLGAIAAAIAIGAAGALGPRALIPLAIVIVVPIVVVLWGASITDALVASLFLEAVTLGGITLSRVLAPVAMIVLLVALMRGTAVFRPAPLIIPIALYALWGVSSLLWTVSTPHTVEILGSLVIALTYMFSFAVFIRSERDLRRTLVVLTAASLLIGAASTAAFAGFALLPADSLQGGRGQGGVGDPNFFATVQLIALPLILLMLAESRTIRGRVFFASAALVAITSIFATLSRGGMIALVLILLTLPFLPASWLFGTRQKKAAVLLAMLIGVGVLFTRPAFRAEVVGRVETLIGGQPAAEAGGSSAGSGRTELWKAAFTTISERPVLGLGLGAFPSQSNQLLFRSPGVRLDLIATHPSGIEAHSAYIGTTADLGFVGLGLFLSIIAAIYASLAWIASRARRVGAWFISRVAVALVLGTMGWTVSSAFIETETARPIWVVMGLTFALTEMLRRHEAEARRRAAEAPAGTAG